MHFQASAYDLTAEGDFCDGHSEAIDLDIVALYERNVGSTDRSVHFELYQPNHPLGRAESNN